MRDILIMGNLVSDDAQADSEPLQVGSYLQDQRKRCHALVAMNANLA